MHLVSKKKKKLKITGQVYSSCGKFFATIENNKKLSVYNVSKPSVDKYKLTQDIDVNDRLYLSANAKYLCARRGKTYTFFYGDTGAFINSRTEGNQYNYYNEADYGCIVWYCFTNNDMIGCDGYVRIILITLGKNLQTQNI